jgi:hypothetical protein
MPQRKSEEWLDHSPKIKKDGLKKFASVFKNLAEFG